MAGQDVKVEQLFGGMRNCLHLCIGLMTNNDMNRVLSFLALASVAMLVSCSSVEKKADVTLSGLNVSDFEATIDSVDNHLYIITNKAGMEACVMNYGARLVSLMVPDRNGVMGDVVCGFPTIADYTDNSQNFGATVGRYIGRILGGECTIAGEKVVLQKGSNGHCAHGGNPNFGARMWRTVDVKENAVTLEYVSPDGENGFPGCLTLAVTYTLTEDNGLEIEYDGSTDKPTVVNVTNHSFFNISGNPRQSIENQMLCIHADSITAYDDNKCVTGEYLPVTGSPFDFRTPRPIGERIDEENAQLAATKGYDHCWTTGFSSGEGEPVAWVYDEESGRKMEVYTTEPGLHIYTSNGLKGNLTGKQGIVYERRTSVCFETCHFQNSPNYPQFPSTLLLPGEKFTSRTLYKFVK